MESFLKAVCYDCALIVLRKTVKSKDRLINYLKKQLIRQQNFLI